MAVRGGWRPYYPCVFTYKKGSKYKRVYLELSGPEMEARHICPM